MLRRRLLLLAGAVAVVITVTFAVYTVVVVLPTQPGVNKSNFDRIEKGMTKAEVVTILGEGVAVGHGVDYVIWFAPDRSNAVVAFMDDRVESMDWHPSNETLWDKLQRWLHLT